jgi:hypothetical protein
MVNKSSPYNNKFIMTPEVFEGQGIGIAFSPGRAIPSKKCHKMSHSKHLDNIKKTKNE